MAARASAFGAALVPKRPYLYAYYAALIAVGLMGGVLGPTLGGLAAQVGSDLKGVSAVLVARSLGYMLGSLLTGRLLDRFPGHPVLAWGCVLAAMALGAVPFADGLGVLALLLLLMGLFDASLDVGGNTLLVWVYRKQAAPYLNGLHFAFGVGAFISPLIVAQALLLSGTVAGAYWVMGGMVLLLAPFLVLLPSPPHDASHAKAKTAKVRWGLVSLFVAFAMFYSAAEAGLGSWIYSYAVAVGLEDAPHAAYLTSLFWGTLTLGRLASIPLAAKFKTATLIRADLIFALMSMVLLLLFPSSRPVLWVATAMAGLALASMFPMLLILAHECMPLPGKVNSLFFVGLSLGAISLPWLIGRFFEARGPWVLPGAVLGVLVCSGLVFSILLRVALPKPKSRR